MASNEEGVEEIETDAVKSAALLRPETYGYDGKVDFAKWRALPREKIWPHSRFACLPPKIADECAYGECESHQETPSVPSDKPVNKKKVDNLECKRCHVKYCSKECRKKNKGLHSIACQPDLDPKEVLKFLFALINTKPYQSVAQYANDIFRAGMKAACQVRILLEGQESFDLVQDEEQTNDAFARDLGYAFRERTLHALVVRRIEQAVHTKKYNDPEPAWELLATTTSPFAGANLFILIALASGGRKIIPPLIYLFANIMKYLVAVDNVTGFRFFTLEEGEIEPGIQTNTDDGLTFKQVYARDMVLENHMSAVYLIVLTTLEGHSGPMEMRTSVLWRAGNVSHLHHALPGHYSLGEWMLRDEKKVDTRGYAAKYMTQTTVVDQYLRDLTLLTDNDASEKERREAFCNAFALHPKNLDVKYFGGVDDTLPMFSVSICRAFTY